MGKPVWVDVTGAGLVRRIFKNVKEAVAAGCATSRVSRRTAVKEIRDQVFERQKGRCRNCPARLTKKTMHLHEKTPRGRGGGIGVENSVGLCSACHIGLRGEHSNRMPRFTGRTEKGEAPPRKIQIQRPPRTELLNRTAFDINQKGDKQ